MGQRNCTYIITEFKHGFSTPHYTKIVPIYNGWNFIEVQAPKMVRGIKAVLKINWDSNIRFRMDTPLDVIYQAAAGLNSYFDKDKKKKVSQWVGGYEETQCYLDGTYDVAFQEDNNNGWNIVKFIVDPIKETVTVQIYCVVGREDKDDTSSKSLESYFLGKDKKTNKKDVQYLSQFQWNPKLKAEAKKLLGDLVKQGDDNRKEIIEKYDSEQVYRNEQ